MSGFPWRLLLPIVYMAVMYALSSIPGAQPDTVTGALMQWVTPVWQNFLHIPLYAGLTFSWIWALGSYPVKRSLLLILAFILAATWGILDEYHQSYVPGRYASITDMLLNVLGVSLALIYSRQRLIAGK